MIDLKLYKTSSSYNLLGYSMKGHCSLIQHLSEGQGQILCRANNLPLISSWKQTLMSEESGDKGSDPNMKGRQT